MDDEFGGVYERIELPLLIDDGSFFWRFLGWSGPQLTNFKWGFDF